MYCMYFTDRDGLKAAPFWNGVVSEDTLQKLRSNNLGAKEQQAIDLVATLPLVDAKHIKDTRKAFAATGMLHAMPLIGKFQPKFDHNTLNVTHAQWEAGQPTTAMLDAIKTVAALDPDHVLVPRTAKSMLKALENNEIEAQTFSKIENFATTQSVALFCCLDTGEEGYLDKNGRLGLLGEAQTYGSEAEMKAALKRYAAFHEYRQLQVVHLNVSVSHVGGMEYPVDGGSSWRMLTVDFSQSSLPQVQAHVQQKMLEEALRQMSDEQLQEMLDKRGQAPKKKM